MLGPNDRKISLEPDEDLKNLVEENSDKVVTTKDHFYDIFDSKLIRLIKRISPIWLHKKYHKWSYDNDELLTKLQKLWDNFRDKYLKWWYKIRWWHQDNLSGMYSHRIPNSWSWAKFGWNNYDWDYHYFLRTLKFKLERMEKCIRGYDRHVNTDIYCDQMKLALECLDRVLDDEYTTYMYKELEEIYPRYQKINFIDRKENKKVWLDKHGKKHVVYETKCSSSKEEPKDYQETWLKLNHYYYQLKIADLRIFFHIMTPEIMSYKKWLSIRDFNSEIYKKYGHTDEAENKVRNIHYGLFSWWD